MQSDRKLDLIFLSIPHFWGVCIKIWVVWESWGKKLKAIFVVFYTSTWRRPGDHNTIGSAPPLGDRFRHAPLRHARSVGTTERAPLTILKGFRAMQIEKPTFRIRRLRISGNGSTTIFLPFGLGCVFPTCWDGSRTRIHYAEDSPCPNCKQFATSTSASSLHCARYTPESPTVCVCLGHVETYLLYQQIQFPMRMTSLSLRIASRSVQIVGKGKDLDSETVKLSREMIARVAHKYFSGELRRKELPVHWEAERDLELL
jgi:hypothetical protein